MRVKPLLGGVSVCSVPSLHGVVEHVVNLGTDVRLACEIVVGEEEVVVWRLAGPGHHDRILSVGKMLVRNDGKGKLRFRVWIEILRPGKPPLKAVVRNVPLSIYSHILHGIASSQTR